MPLESGSSKKAVSSNIKKLIAEGYDRPGQAVAISLEKSRKKKK